MTIPVSEILIMVNFANHLQHPCDVSPNMIAFLLTILISAKVQEIEKKKKKNYCEFEFKLIISTFTFYIYGCWFFLSWKKKFENVLINEWTECKETWLK